MESFAELFALVLENCRGRMSNVAFDLWLKDIVPVRLDDSTAYLKVNSDFKMNIVKEKYTSILKSAFEDTLGFPVELDISCDAPSQPQTGVSDVQLPPPKVQPPAGSPSRFRQRGRRLHLRHLHRGFLQQIRSCGFRGGGCQPSGSL